MKKTLDLFDTYVGFQVKNGRIIKQKHFNNSVNKDDSMFNGATEAESMQYGGSKYNTTIRDV